MSDSATFAIPAPLKSLSKAIAKPKPANTAPKPKTNAKPQQQMIFHKFILDPSNVNQLFTKNVLIMKTLQNPDATHKFIIPNTKPRLSRLSILKTFVQQARPYVIMPMDITGSKGKSIEFICTCCEGAIKKLCETDKLMLTCMMKESRVQVPMTLIVGFKSPQPINARERILELIKSRITNSPPVTVNLQNLERLVETAGIGKIYFDIHNPQTLQYILRSLRALHPKVLNLSHNNITTIKWRRPIQFESIDLSYNKIVLFEDLGSILRLDLKEIDLRGNPVCQEFNYLKRVKTLFPTAEVIDSKSIQRIDVEIEENYFPTSDAAEYLVDQFMEHYFNLYDDPKKRRYLQDIYHRDALFTLTSNIVDEEALSPASQRYKHHAHNLLDTRSATDFSVGPAEIIRKICYLPQIEHDPRTFTVDILHYAENKSAMFIIYGVCREVPSPTMTEPVLYMFNRSFMLLGSGEGEFQIINDMLYVSNRKVELVPAIKPFNESFMYRKTIEITKKIPTAISKEEKDGFLTIYMELTSLHVTEATEFLERSKWNMREALEIFIHDYRFEEIDCEAYIHDEIKNVLFSDFLMIRPGMNRQNLGKVLEKLRTLQKEGFLIKPNGVKKQDWRKHIMTLKQMLIKESVKT